MGRALPGSGIMRPAEEPMHLNVARPLLVIALLGGVACAQERPHGPGEHGDHGKGHAEHDDATVHHRFDDPKRAERMFEDPERDAWQLPDQVLKVLALKPTDKVVDIGSATGYFPVRFAKAVPQGVVYGVDIEPALVNYLNLRAHREGLTNLVSLVCKPDDPCIPEPVDVVFICDTYHHISDRVAYFTRLAKLLRPGGRLVIVDYDPAIPSQHGPPQEKRISVEQIERELKGAGYRLTRRETLKVQYVAVFERIPAEAEPGAR